MKQCIHCKMFSMETYNGYVVYIACAEKHFKRSVPRKSAKDDSLLGTVYLKAETCPDFVEAE